MYPIGRLTINELLWVFNRESGVQSFLCAYTLLNNFCPSCLATRIEETGNHRINNKSKLNRLEIEVNHFTTAAGAHHHVLIHLWIYWLGMGCLFFFLPNPKRYSKEVYYRQRPAWYMICLLNGYLPNGIEWLSTRGTTRKVHKQVPVTEYRRRNPKSKLASYTFYVPIGWGVQRPWARSQLVLAVTNYVPTLRRKGNRGGHTGETQAHW